MSIAGSISRLAEYHHRHGFAATVSRAQLAAKRILFAGRMVVFYCELDDPRLSQVNLPQAGTVRRLSARTELIPEQFQQMTEFWNPKLAGKNIDERFGKGASLWLAECEGRLAGYGWTLQGSTIEPYYFPLAKNDVHLFDFHVFPQFRGRGINPFLVGRILSDLASRRGGRAFIEAAEWNAAQLSSLEKTAFHRYGLVRSIRLFGHTFVSWVEKQRLPVDTKNANSSDKALRIVGSREQ
jgi:ribosomal protein S18 acetylase RimI-like enzyme